MADKIPTSNKPGDSKKDGAAPGKDDQLEAAFKQKLDKAVQETRDEIAQMFQEASKVENLKIKSMWSTGSRIADLCPTDERGKLSKVIQAFTDGVANQNLAPNYYYRCNQLVRLFSKDDYDNLVKHKVTVRTVFALLSIENEALRRKMFDRAIAGELNETDIRKLNTTKSKKTRKTKSSDRQLPPVRVFNKGLERVDTFNKIIGSCQDAAGRLGDCKDEENRMEAVQQLQELRKGMLEVQDSISAFLKMTGSFDKTKISKPK